MEENIKKYIADNFDNALARGYIQVYYQPVIRTISGRLCSFEALARWIDPVKGFIRPDIFISVLEEEERIHLLDSYIIREVCRQIRRSIDNGKTPIPVSVNLSRLDFTLCDVISMVDQHVSEFHIAHDYLYIEITESVLGEQEGLMRTVVDRFHAAGYQVWMDDFGSGFSSLNMLKDYTFDELKLDMVFLRSFDQRSRRIMTYIIQMAKEIGIHTLAEGVETEEQYRYLRNVGCEKIQGYYIGRPLPFDEALENLKEKNIEIEPPRYRKYYDDIGHINFLSATPFLSMAEKKRDITGRQLNSIPLALIEMRKKDFSILFANSAFEKNAGTTVLLPDIFREDQMGMYHSYSICPGRVINFLESTRSDGQGRMMFVSNEEYYELKGKCIARRRGAYSVLLQLNNLSQAAQSGATSVLDDGIRQIYSTFERISLLDLKKNTITPLYSDMKSDVLGKVDKNLSEIAKIVAREWVLLDDREAFIKFWDAETLEKRLSGSGRGSISEYFRCKVNNGRYGWKQFLMVRYKPGLVLELVRDAHGELGSFTANSAFTDHSSADISTETLWQNLIHTDVIRLFWKDKDRRFLGVNQGFLNFYGFQSDKDLIGKTDEDLGWHVHPDLYMNDEYRVINEGINIRNIPGNCISNGVNQEIMASKTPLFDLEGNIVGMLGYFVDRDPTKVNDVSGEDNIGLDEMTGLLNSYGLREQAQAFADEYHLRGTDFLCMNISLDELPEINQEFGFEFGDKVITKFGRQIKAAFGTKAAVGRVSGNHFLIIHQIKKESEVQGIRDRVKKVAANIHEVEDTPITLYISLGYSLFSESHDLEIMAQSAEIRLLVDHDGHVPVEDRLSCSSDFFCLYDELPISFAVYKVHTNRHRKVTDAELFYANHLFERRAGKPMEELLGRSVRDLFPVLDENWFEIAGRAALKGETIIEQIYYEDTDMHYHITASQIIRPGFCSFTYQEVDPCGNPTDLEQL